jgi:hypothetical protein
MARWFVNPSKARHGGRVHRPRVRRAGAAFILGKRSPYKGHVHRINPYLTELGMLANPRRRHRRHHRRHHRHHYRHNPGQSLTGGVMRLVRNPLPFVTDGAFGILGAYVAVTVPTMFLPPSLNGVDLMSKLVRGLARAVTGMGAYMVAKKTMPRSAPAVLVGATIGAAGSLVLDLLNTRLILGAGDNQQSVMGLFGGGVSGLGLYNASRLGYTIAARRGSGVNGIYGGNSPALTGAGGRIYG